MLFSSPQFLAFFGAYLALHLLVPLRWRLALVIIGSTVFYGYWNPWYVWIPHALMILAYYGAIWMERARGTPSHGKRVAWVVALLLTPLAIVKYTNFVYQDVLGPVLGFSGRIAEWSLPLGISFVTFTMISYVVDVYRGKYAVEMRPGLLAGLVLFFPHLIAGPILRPHDLLPQLARPRRATRALGVRIVFGLAIFSVGLLKKLVFADPIAESVEGVFGGTGAGITAPQYLLSWYGFGLQIYCDFSGYTDMAIGIAMILGIRLPTNFQHPYTSSSIVEFWRRWHITLSTWLRDYLYIPLGGNRSNQTRNIMITMVLGGLWHGANWTFILWGFWHGLGIACVHHVRQSRFARAVAAVPRWMMVVLTFHFVTVGWILFRAPNLPTAWRVLVGPFVAPWGDLAGFASANAFLLSLIAIFFVTHRWDSHRNVRAAVRKLPAAVYWPVVVMIWLLAIAVSQGSSAKFIYFDF